MKLNQFNFNLRPETALGQIWETVRQWILNSPYSKFKKVPRKLPTKISEGKFEWSANEAKDDIVKLSRVGDGMEIVSSRVRKALKWRTVMTFTRQKKQVKCSVKVLIDGTTSDDSEQESKAPRIVKQLMKTYGLQAERRGGESKPKLNSGDIDSIVKGVTEGLKNKGGRPKKEKEGVPRMSQKDMAAAFGPPCNAEMIRNWERYETTGGLYGARPHGCVVKKEAYVYSKELRLHPGSAENQAVLAVLIKDFKSTSAVKQNAKDASLVHHKSEESLYRMRKRLGV